MTEQLPRFSMIVPTHDRPKQLAACLGSITRLDYPRDRFELIIVDDGSEEPPNAVVEPLRDQIDVRIYCQPNAGPATARNKGAANATGTYLAFTDDDCAPAPDWLTTLAARFASTARALIGGRTINMVPRNACSAASQMLIAYLYSYYNADPARARFLTSNNFALPADLFRASGGFERSYTRAAAEDREFCDRWLHLGHRMIYAPEVLVSHFHSLTLPKFWGQHFNYGRGAFQFHRARATRNPGRIRLEPLAFYANLLRYPFSDTPKGRAPLLAVLMAVSQAANAAGYLWERLASDVVGDRSCCRT